MPKMRPNVFKKVDGSIEVYGWNEEDPSRKVVYLECKPEEEALAAASAFVYLKFGYRI